MKNDSKDQDFAIQPAVLHHPQISKLHHLVTPVKLVLVSSSS